MGEGLREAGRRKRRRGEGSKYPPHDPPALEPLPREQHQSHPGQPSATVTWATGESQTLPGLFPQMPLGPELLWPQLLWL